TEYCGDGSALGKSVKPVALKHGAWPLISFRARVRTMFPKAQVQNSLGDDRDGTLSDRFGIQARGGCSCAGRCGAIWFYQCLCLFVGPIFVACGVAQLLGWLPWSR